MDFTYLIALFGSVIVGFVSASIFVAFRGSSLRKLIGVALTISVVLDFVILIDWRRSDEITSSILLFDGAIFAVYGLFGVVIGVLPVLGVRWLYRRLKAEGYL